MECLFSSPNRPLSDFVERFWQISDAPTHHQERIMPGGTMVMVINLHEDEFRIYDPAQPERCKRFSGAILAGAYGSSFVIDARQQVSVIGIYFKPAGAFPFLGTAAGDLADTHIDLETLWGTSAIELRDRLCAAVNFTERVRLLEKALLSHLFRPLEHHPAVGFALNAFRQGDSNPTVREIVQETGLSQRRFIQLFTREVGMSPKLYCRVRRFQQAIARIRQTQIPDWAELVLDCGYFDQSHLIHDFRSFSGLKPTEYLRQRNNKVMENHVPLVR